MVYLVFDAIGSKFQEITGVGEAIVYEQSCLGGKTEDVFLCTAQDGELTVRKRQFKVDFEHQRVIERGAFFAKPRCTVFDSNNWYCSSEDFTVWEQMSDGSYASSDDYVSKTHKANYVPVVRYWYYYWKGFFL